MSTIIFTSIATTLVVQFLETTLVCLLVNRQKKKALKELDNAL